MDILLNPKGDLCITSKGDILLKYSVSQKIKIRLKWLEGEWRWRKEEGLPYLEGLMVKNPDTDAFEAIIRSKIFEVEEVTEVRNVTIVLDHRTRQATIQFLARTDQEIIKEEVKISCQSMG